MQNMHNAMSSFPLIRHLTLTATATSERYPLSLHDALPISPMKAAPAALPPAAVRKPAKKAAKRSEEHTSELQSRVELVCSLLLEKKKVVSNQALHTDQDGVERCVFSFNVEQNDPTSRSIIF